MEALTRVLPNHLSPRPTRPCRHPTWQEVLPTRVSADRLVATRRRCLRCRPCRRSLSSRPRRPNPCRRAPPQPGAAWGEAAPAQDGPRHGSERGTAAHRKVPSTAVRIALQVPTARRRGLGIAEVAWAAAEAARPLDAGARLGGPEGSAGGPEGSAGGREGTGRLGAPLGGAPPGGAARPIRVFF